MKNKNTIFDYLTHVMIIWGISILGLCLFCVFFGKDAKGFSSIFALGNEGLSIASLMEFFLLSVVIAALRWVFFSDILIKKLSILFRTIMMVVCVILFVGVFAGVFRWFPVDQVRPWIMFFICFFLCAAVSVLVSAIKEKSDNRKLEEALLRLKGENK